MSQSFGILFNKLYILSFKRNFLRATFHFGSAVRELPLAEIKAMVLK